MQAITILGYSENALSLVLETLRALGEKRMIPIIQNIPIETSGKPPYLPAGMEVTVQVAGENWHLSTDEQYIFGVLNPEVKKKVFDFFCVQHKITEQNYIDLVHPSSLISASVQMKGGCYIEPLTVISPFVQLGFGVTVNRGVTIGHHAVLEDFVTIGPGVNIAGHTGIGAHTSIGIGAAVFDHIRIGKNSKIGGGSVVTKDIPDNVVAWGNPCRVIKAIAP
ncbi:MAG: hypothetical protein IT250_15305 [Chitinophagaceae bacterium]|nr:hypothetical protein [Chitinophagaceae bacterium]